MSILVPELHVITGEMGLDENPTIFTSAVVQDLVGMFECPLCYDCIMPPIMQCYNGHLMCDPCSANLTHCPKCRCTLTTIRNLGMEKVGNKLNFPCKYAIQGCNAVLKYTEKRSHEVACKYRPYYCICPSNSCTWKGRFNGVLQHLRLSHPYIPILSEDRIQFTAIGIRTLTSAEYMIMQSCFGHMFLLRMKKQLNCELEQDFEIIVRLIGTPNEAKDFLYRLSIQRNEHCLIWEAATPSMEECCNSSVVKSNSLFFGADLSQYFVDNDRLSMNVTIKPRSPNQQGRRITRHLFLDIDPDK